MPAIIDVDSHFEPGADWLAPYPKLAARLPKLDPSLLAVDAIVGDLLRDVPAERRPPVAELLLVVVAEFAMQLLRLTHHGVEDAAPALESAHLLCNLILGAIHEKLRERHPCGISLLAAPREFSDAGLVNATNVGQALAFATELFPDVVVDLEDCFHEEQVLVLQDRFVEQVF